MSEGNVSIIVAVVTALGSIITALFGWLAKKGMNYLDQKTKFLDETADIQKKESLKQRIVDIVTLVVRSTMQTYVDTIKEKSADGKLTKEESKEAFDRTFAQAWDILKREGLGVTKEFLTVVVEAVVSKLKEEQLKNSPAASPAQ